MAKAVVIDGKSAFSLLPVFKISRGVLMSWDRMLTHLALAS